MLREQAPAKLNLTLHILGKRADGYHEVESLVAFAAVGDVLTAEAADEVTLTLDGVFAEAAGGGEGNLVIRAARLFQQKTGCTKGAAMHLTKHIPVGAGLGGGSADAAATLRVLNRLWGLDVPIAQLGAWAPELGADVAMCIASRPVMARGVGEQLSALKNTLPPLHAVLVHPRTALLTKDVYAAFRLTPAMPSTGDGDTADHTVEWMQYLAAGRNDLESAASEVSNEVGQVRTALQKAEPTPLLVRMSGSGACCYGLYETAADAAKSAAAITQAHPHWWVVSTKLST
jgi:4-diphosphocytidyl-2-C-methyl-D-erythritol kinase